MTYSAVMELAREHPYSPGMVEHQRVNWLQVIRACCEEHRRVEAGGFAGAWVRNKVGWFPGLSMLSRYGILRKRGETTRGGRRAYWIVVDVEGTERALAQLGC